MSIGLYLHFPFCTNKCAYCDFYKEVHSLDAEQRFFAALTVETELAAARLPETERVIDTIYIGGGTPSLASFDLLSNWLNQVRRLFEINPKTEFSLECNPESVNRDKLEALGALGVNRPVIGIQSFEPELLMLLDRKHDPANSYEAVYLAHALGFASFGVDLIFGLPGQTSGMLSKDLDMLVDLDPPHVSFYQLTIEPGTGLARKVESGLITPSPDELLLALYQGGVEKFESAGLARYEVGSFAHEGHQCRHNMGYWTGRDYIGLGPGAHSFIGSNRFAVVADLGTYFRALGEGVWPVVEDSSGPEERQAEAIMLGLRLTEGVRSDRFAQRFGVRLEDCLDSEQAEQLVESGHLISDAEGVRLTPAGFLQVDSITERLLR